MIIILLPALLVIFIAGWCMYVMGNQKRSNNRQQSKPIKKDKVKDNVTIMPIIHEETPEMVNE